MDVVTLTYTVRPAFRDGYAVSVALEDIPILKARLSKLIYSHHNPDPEQHPWPYRSMPQPDIFVEQRDAAIIRDTLPRLRVPVISRCGANVRDGIHSELAITSMGYRATLAWQMDLPKDIEGLALLVDTLVSYAKRGNLE